MSLCAGTRKLQTPPLLYNKQNYFTSFLPSGCIAYSCNYTMRVLQLSSFLVIFVSCLFCVSKAFSPQEMAQIQTVLDTSLSKLETKIDTNLTKLEEKISNMTKRFSKFEDKLQYLVRLNPFALIDSIPTKALLESGFYGRSIEEGGGTKTFGILATDNPLKIRLLTAGHCGFTLMCPELNETTLVLPAEVFELGEILRVGAHRNANASNHQWAHDILVVEIGIHPDNVTLYENLPKYAPYDPSNKFSEVVGDSGEDITVSGKCPFLSNIDHPGSIMFTKCSAKPGNSGTILHGVDAKSGRMAPIGVYVAREEQPARGIAAPLPSEEDILWLNLADTVETANRRAIYHYSYCEIPPLTLHGTPRHCSFSVFGAEYHALQIRDFIYTVQPPINKNEESRSRVFKAY